MRVANLDGRLALVREDIAVDVELASNGLFGPDPQAIYDQWAAFRTWAQSLDSDAPWTPFEASPARRPASGWPGLPSVSWHPVTSSCRMSRASVSCATG